MLKFDYYYSIETFLAHIGIVNSLYNRYNISNKGVHEKDVEQRSESVTRS